ncbi:MAG: hypothetical protein AAGA06_07400 [Pseudomonadota bacterium]
MTGLPELTVLLGPQTQLALAMNAHLRENRLYLAKHGITALPSRLASPILRASVDERPEDERLAQFAEKTAPRPAILSAINMFGPPEAGLLKGELFPDAELKFAGLAPVVGSARVVIFIDALPSFFIAAKSETLEDRVRRTSWEVLYELGWFELLSELVEFLPDAQFTVVSGKVPGDELARLPEALIGPQSDSLPSPFAFLQNLITETGRAVLARILERGAPDAATIADLYTSFARRPTPDDLRDRLGIDKLTGILLDQRFEEDIEKLSTFPRVTVF